MSKGITRYLYSILFYVLAVRIKDHDNIILPNACSDIPPL